MISEHQEQKALFQWAGLHKHKDLFARRLFSIPNAGGSGLNGIRRGIQMKEEGLKADTADIFFAHPVPMINQDFHAGLFIEMKDYGKYLTKGQKEFIQEMRLAGYMAFGVRGWIRAAELIDLYINDVWKIEPLNDSDDLYFGDSKKDVAIL